MRGLNILKLGLGLAVAAAWTFAPSARAQSTVGGCACQTSGSCDDVSFSNIPSNDQYVITTFGGGSDTQPLACGGSADGTWAYVADEARFGCGAKLSVSANGKTCIAQVADCGPNQCVELAAASSGCTTNQPVLDSSPLIAMYLYGTDSAGWSDGMMVTVTQVASDSAIGCPGGSGGSEDAGTSSDDAGASGDDAGTACTLPSGESGECMDTSTCRTMGGVSTAGFCPGPDDVECCTGVGESTGAGSSGGSSSAGATSTGGGETSTAGGESSTGGGTTSPGATEASPTGSGTSAGGGATLGGAPPVASTRGGTPRPPTKTPSAAEGDVTGPGSSGGCAMPRRDPSGPRAAGLGVIALAALVAARRRRSERRI